MSHNLLWRNALASAGAFFLLAVAGAAYSQEAGQVVQAIGDVRLAGTPAKVGDTVQAGDALHSGGDGYLYIKTVDGGFLILRPRSEARVLAYTIDAAQPANNRIKFELSQGVARSISGAAVKESRQNFRFNTPVAAIGVRGTDFTVFTDAQTTRVAVVSGGVVVSGFGAGCTAQGIGPCEGSAKRELFAGQDSQVLQVIQGQAVPQLLRGNTLLPDVNAPPRADEPAKSSASSTPSSAAASAVTANGINGNQDPNLAPLKLATLDQQLHQLPVPAVAPDIGWGRWQALVDKPVNVDLVDASRANNIVAANSYFALLRNKDATWTVPSESSVTFLLRDHQAQIQADGGRPTAAAVDSGSLSVNFVSSTFATQLGLVAQGQRTALVAEGLVNKDGTFSNTSQFSAGSNMAVQGVVANNPDLKAGYVFQSRLNDGRLASGVTYWGR